MPNATPETQWVAVFLDQDHKAHWPGMFLTSDNKMRLDIINYCELRQIYFCPWENKSVIHGCLDYQKPVTFLDTFVSSRGGFDLMSGYSRAKFSLTVNHYVVGAFIADINELSVNEIVISGDAPGSIMRPKIPSVVQRNGITFYDDDSVEDIFPYRDYKIILRSGLRKSISPNDYKISQKSKFSVVFKNKISFKSSIDFLHLFLSLIFFFAGYKKKDNEYFVSVDGLNDPLPYYFNFAGKYKDDQYLSPFADDSYSQYLCDIFDKINQRQPNEYDPTLYIRIVSACEMNEGTLLGRFLQIVGCMQEFCRHVYFQDSHAYFSPCIERMVSDLKNAGYQGNTDHKKLKSIRDNYAHGSMGKITQDETVFVAHCIPYLCAVSRYHILKYIGMSQDEIEKLFSQSYEYMKFAPLKGREGQVDEQVART